MEPDPRPNVVLIMTDDQGWAQLGSHGDPVLQTPHLDSLAAESVEMTRFYVSPVCAPTRAALMTGRYNYRTGVVDTYLGRAMMHPDEATIAEILGSAGYRTGIFGKWHLGDNYPQRPVDQGFEEAVVHKGGGIGQPSDPPGSDYFDPILFRNGTQESFSGYCTDVYFDEAIRWIGDGSGEPFFAYIPTNAPHSPYLVPDSYREPYAEQGLSDKDARIYGMITNIDDNVGRLMAHLEANGLTGNTIFIFMTDNGPTTRLYNAGLRLQKGSVYENGIRVPFFARWPDELEPLKIDQLGAHIDVVPTLLAATGTTPPSDLHIDGIDLLPLWKGEVESLPERTYFVQAHRGNAPQLYRAFAAVEQQYKLVQALRFGRPEPEPAELEALELYDLIADPGEQQDLAKERPEVLERLKESYERWFEEVSSTRGFDAVRFAVGSDAQPEVTLTRQDWRMVTADGWGRGDPVLGRWEVESVATGPYDATVVLDEPAPVAGTARIGFRETEVATSFSAGQREVRFEGIELAEGEGAIEVRLEMGDETRGAWQVHLVRR
ncbi:MAG: sulfatase-like hydrolase/transferase [Bryobacterales bacterium]|nr:sulfatase-like hydrolase/transferase [Bryobacterales bacterium]